MLIKGFHISVQMLNLIEGRFLARAVVNPPQELVDRTIGALRLLLEPMWPGTMTQSYVYKRPVHQSRVARQQTHFPIRLVPSNRPSPRTHASTKPPLSRRQDGRWQVFHRQRHHELTKLQGVSQHDIWNTRRRVPCVRTLQCRCCRHPRTRRHGRTSQGRGVFTDITERIYQHGGIVAFVHPQECFSEQLRNIIKALSKVLGSQFSTSCILISTKITWDPDATDEENYRVLSEPARLGEPARTPVPGTLWLPELRARNKTEVPGRSPGPVGALWRCCSAVDHALGRHLAPLRRCTDE